MVRGAGVQVIPFSEVYRHNTSPKPWVGGWVEEEVVSAARGRPRLLGGPGTKAIGLIETVAQSKDRFILSHPPCKQAPERRNELGNPLMVEAQNWARATAGVGWKETVLRF